MEVGNGDNCGRAKNVLMWNCEDPVNAGDTIDAGVVLIQEDPLQQEMAT